MVVLALRVTSVSQGKKKSREAHGVCDRHFCWRPPPARVVTLTPLASVRLILQHYTTLLGLVVLTEFSEHDASPFPFLNFGVTCVCETYRLTLGIVGRTNREQLDGETYFSIE